MKRLVIWLIAAEVVVLRAYELWHLIRRNERVWFAVCPKGHWPLFDNRPKEVDICTLCKEKLTYIDEGFVSHKERNQGFAESFPSAIAKGPILLDKL